MSVQAPEPEQRRLTSVCSSRRSFYIPHWAFFTRWCLQGEMQLDAEQNIINHKSINSKKEKK
jgi:hypothetical protein